jgi:transposase
MAESGRPLPLASLKLLRELPAAQSVEAVEALLPWNLHRQDLASEMAP